MKSFFISLCLVISTAICFGRHNIYRRHDQHTSRQRFVNEAMSTLRKSNGSLLEFTTKKHSVASMKKDSVAKREGETDTFDSINNELKELMGKLDKKPASILAINMDDPLAGVKGITGGIEKTYPGMIALVDGIKKKDPFKIATSALTIASGVSMAVGGPIGLLIATVLNFASTMINILKPQEKEESQEDMMKRVIVEALQEFRQDKLMASFTGFTKKSEMLKSNLRFVDDFLKKEMKDFGTTGDVHDFLTTSGTFDSKSKKNSEFTQQNKFNMLKSTLINEILPTAYEVMYDGVSTLGKIEYEIENMCDLVATKTNDGERVESAEKCLKILQLYSEMSYQRRFTYLAQLTTTLQNIINSNKMDDDTKGKAIAHLSLIADTIKITEEQDVKVMEFFVKPVYSYKRRFIINYFYSNQNRFPHLDIYLASLGIKQNFGLFICTETSLLGSCRDLNLHGLETKKSVVFEFDNMELFVPLSVMVPKDYKAVVKYKENAKNPITIYGPNTISLLYLEKVDPSPVRAIHVSKMTAIERKSDALKVCRVVQESRTHKSLCNQILLNKLQGVYYAGSMMDKDTEKWKGYYKSVSVPNNVAVFGEGISVSENIDFLWGPYFGPRVIDKLPGSIIWSNLKTFDYSNGAIVKDYSTRFCKIDKNLEVCKLSEILSAKFLEICKEEGLMGYCDSIPIRLGDDNRQIINLDQIHMFARKMVTENDKGGMVNLTLLQQKGFSFTLYGGTTTIKFDSMNDDSIWKPSMKNNKPYNVLKSMRIPDGFKVELMTDLDGDGIPYGIYRGPEDIITVDGNLDKKSLINSIIIKKAE